MRAMRAFSAKTMMGKIKMLFELQVELGFFAIFYDISKDFVNKRQAALIKHNVLHDNVMKEGKL